MLKLKQFITAYNKQFIIAMGLFGFFSCKSQNQVIEARYEAVQMFHNGLAAARMNGLWGYIDTTGN